MRTIGRTALTGLVWLTAAMTLVAGLPHFDCRCPSGQVKPFCLATASKKTGCCCGGACCTIDEICCGNRCAHVTINNPGCGF